jgi:outer membrane protein OmpA-like peptidoglycan-associated protein
MKKLLLTGLIAGGVLSLSACTAHQQGVAAGTGIGAAVGAGVGAIIGHQTGDRNKGAAIGAGAGALLGAVIGDRMTRQKEELQQVPGVENVNYDPQQQTIETKMQVLFDVDKDLIKPSEASKLDQLAAVFAKYPENIVLIEGHTDSDGTDAYNQKLSERRAKSIENYLRAKNLGIASLTSIGYGESRPVADNTTAAGKAQNRRVELKISVDQSRVPMPPQQQQ